MDLKQYQELGDRVWRAYQRVNFDPAALPDVATELLQAAEFDPFDFPEIARFLSRTSVTQHPGSSFGDVPVMVYRSPEFYIELLVWNESTTVIHEHAFSGAFRVLAGSSIHSTYTFEEQQRFGDRLLLGRTHLADIELLTPGGTRPIAPGHGGLTHALFHLEQPSVTIVVRTDVIDAARPQYAVRKPHFAFDEFGLRSDTRLQMMRRVLRGLLAAGDPGLHAVMLETVVDLDLPRLFMLIADLDTFLPAEKDQEAFFAAVQQRHGDVSRKLREALECDRVEQSLRQARRHTADPESRFFLALLLNAPDRGAFDRVVALRYPGEDPKQRTAAWLARIADPEFMLDVLVHSKAVLRKTRQGEGLLSRLSSTLTYGKAINTAVAEAALAGAGDEGWLDALKQQNADPSPDDWKAAREALRRLPELGTLF